MRPKMIGLASAMALAFGAGAAAAQDVVLKAVSGFPEGTLYSQKFEQFIKDVNAKGGAVKLQIQFLGGAPKVMPTFDVGKNLKDGVFDVMGSTGAYYTNVLPEADSFKLTEITIQELRKTGGWDYINKLHNEKMNAYYLARVHDYEEFHIYLNKEIAKPDFTGLKIRVTPIYRAMVEKLGGTAVTSPPPEVYTLLERNTVDGYGWPLRGIFDFSWQKVTKYRIDPGFYNADLHIVVNLAAWRTKLNDAQRKLMQDTALAIEAKGVEDKPLNDAERKKQAEAGIKAIRFSPEDEKKYLQVAREAAWESVLKVSPEHGPKLRELFTKR